MKSPITGKEMELKLEKNILVFRKEEFEYTHKSYYCEDSGESFTTTELDEFNLNQVYNQYRDKHNIPFPDEIREFREKYSFSYADITKILNFGTNSYRNYEKGEVPNPSNATFLRSVIYSPSSSLALEGVINSSNDISEQQKISFLKKITKVKLEEEKNERKNILINYIFDYSLMPDKFSGFKKPNFDKLTEMIVYFADKVKPTATKMNKLLFYADFLNYSKAGVSISGARYYAHMHGPVPSMFRTHFDYLAKNDIVDLVTEQYPNGYVGERFLKSIHKDFESSLFTEEELINLNSIVEKFKTCSASEIRELSHEEDAWLENEKDKSYIDYEYSFNLKHI